MAVMFAFLGAVAAGTQALLEPMLNLEPVRRVIVDILATAYRAGDVVLEATVEVRKDLAALAEEGRVKARAVPTARPVMPPGPAVKVV